MREWIKHLDRLLRGDATRISSLRQGIIDIPAGGLAVVLVILGMIYGVCMGLFAVIDSGGQRFMQLIATMVKVPLLFFLTLVVTFPSLYVFNALVGSRLRIVSVLHLLVASTGIILAVLASFGTIVAFFSVSTTSYPFMTLLNVLVYAVSGVLGLMFLLQTLHRLTLVQEMEELQAPHAPPPNATPSPDEPQVQSAELPPPLPGALDATEGTLIGRNVRIVFRIWVLVFALVAAQMGWVLRPFIGNPDLPFSWFRPRSGNFFQAVWTSLLRLFGA